MDFGKLPSIDNVDFRLSPELTAFCVEIFSKALPGVVLRGPKPVVGQQGTLF